LAAATGDLPDGKSKQQLDTRDRQVQECADQNQVCDNGLPSLCQLRKLYPLNTATPNDHASAPSATRSASRRTKARANQAVQGRVRKTCRRGRNDCAKRPDC